MQVWSGSRSTPLVLAPNLGSWVRLRRGDPGSAPLLEESYHLAVATNEFQRLAPVMAARAEAAWLQGDLERCQTEARAGYDLALAHNDPGRWGNSVAGSGARGD